MVYASLYDVLVTATVSFASCTITGNIAYNVRLRQPVVERTNDRIAMERAGLVRECLVKRE